MNEQDDNSLGMREELSEDGSKIGIEAEEDEVIEPFDPSEISIQQKVVSMDVLIRRLKQGTIRLSPAYQRNEVWDKSRKSRLIESLMLNIPLPMFYVAADGEGNWEVVDGLQRLSTIRDFAIGSPKEGHHEFLRLSNLEFLGEKFDGKTFPEIESEPNQQKLVNGFFETEMRFTIVNPGTPEAVKRNIFKRINTGGMPLTSQEIRHALYEGASTRLLSKLVKNSAFQNATGNKINDSRMGGRELILRLLSFIVLDRKSYRSNMDSWLSNAMLVINCLPDVDVRLMEKTYGRSDPPKVLIHELDLIEKKFELAMLRASELFGGHAFRKSLPDESRKSPINKSLFDIWGDILSGMSESDYRFLVENKMEWLRIYKGVLIRLDFSNSISRHSSTPKGVVESYSEIYNSVVDFVSKREF